MGYRRVRSIALLLVLIFAAASVSQAQENQNPLSPVSAAFCIPTTGTVSDRFRPGHGGVDIASGLNPGVAPIYAAYAGRVVYRGTMNSGYSLDVAVAVNHGLMNGVYVMTQYHHMGHGSTSYVVVNVGDWVEQGQLVGYQGDYPEPETSGVHLHFGVAELNVPFLDEYTSWGTRCVREDLWYEFGGEDCPSPNPNPAIGVDPELNSYLGSLSSYVTTNCPNSCCCSTIQGQTMCGSGQSYEDESIEFPTSFDWSTNGDIDSSQETIVEAESPAKSVATLDPVETEFETVPSPVSVRRAPIKPQRIPPASASYRIPKSVFGSGGGTKTSTHYVMNSTQGQSTDLSRRTSASYMLWPGYWSRWTPATVEYRIYLPLVTKNQ